MAIITYRIYSASGEHVASCYTRPEARAARRFYSELYGSRHAIRLVTRATNPNRY